MSETLRQAEIVERDLQAMLGEHIRHGRDPEAIVLALVRTLCLYAEYVQAPRTDIEHYISHTFNALEGAEE